MQTPGVLQWRASKKERDSVKLIHNAMNLQPPRSPISSSPPEVEIPSVEERVRYGNIFYSDVGGSSHPPHPSPPGGVFGAYAGYSYGAAGSSQ